jgi:hypothetical protein
MQRAIDYLMVRKRPVLLLGIVLALAGYVLFAPSPFERAFDDNIAHVPLAASIVGRDARLRDTFIRQTEQAFNKGGWTAANRALQTSLVSEVEIYADDAHIRALGRAQLEVLLKLQDNPAACKAYLLAGASQSEYRELAAEFTKLELTHRAAIENGFDRRTSGIKWPKPSDEEIYDADQRLGRGPVAQLTEAEWRAEAKYLDGDAELLCSAAVKKARNMLAMDDPDAADAERIELSNIGKIDVARVLKKLCSNDANGGGCS